MDKVRARDGDGRIQKEPQPDPTEMIDPFLYQYMGRAVNYDRRWVGTMKLGETLGCWCTTPFNRPNMGEQAEALYAKLKAEGKITWAEKGFFFTHAQGVAARKHYEKTVLEGKLKANAKSWGNKHAGFTGTTFEELEKKFPELYKKASAAYVSKAQKLERVQAVKEAIEKKGDDPTIEMISLALLEHDQKWATEDFLEKLLEDQPKEEAEEEVEVIETEPSFDFDQMEPSDEEILAESTPDLEAEDEEKDEEEQSGNLLEQLQASKGPLETSEEDLEPETTSTAASTATEPSYDFDVAESDIEKLVEQVQTLPEPVKARVFENSSKEKIHTDKESVGWKDTDRNERQAFLVEIPGYREMWLEEGMNLVGDPNTAQLWMIEVVIGSE